MAQPNSTEMLALAITHEQVAWSLVRERLPGTADYDPALWRAWLSAMEASDAAARLAVRQAGLPPAAPRCVRTNPPAPVRLPPSSAPAFLTGRPGTRQILAQLRALWPRS